MGAARRVSRALLAVIGVAAAWLPSVPAPLGAVEGPDQIGSWGPVLNWGYQGKHTVLLPTGKVLVFATGDGARVWDPATGAFTPAPALFGDLHCAGHSTLADGRVIVIGGVDGDPHNGIKVTALFDPVSQTWTRGADMAQFRWYPSTTTLADGRVLATSGDAPDGSRALVPEVYDPATDDWTQLTGASRDQSLYPHMYVLPNGRPYEAGPKVSTYQLDLSGGGSWSSGPAAPFSTAGYSESSAMFAPGKILRAGGGDPAWARTAVVDMTAASPAWRELSPMAFPRRRHNLVILADGSVMAVGGTRTADNEDEAVLAGEIWNPVTEQWRTVASMSEARMYHSTGLLLPDGRVLTAGGEAAGRLHAQIYSPPYLFKGARPTVTGAPATAAYGSTFTVSTPDAAEITSVALIRPGAVTHAWDQNQRYVPLTFTADSGSLSVDAPGSGGVAPPGYYMLVVENGAGVPSVARFVRIGTAGSLSPGTITGKVTDAATGTAVSGATVSYSGGGTTTDPDGTYTLANAPAGEHTVTYAATGLATTTRQVTVTPGGTSVVDVALSPPATVTGRVTDATSGAGISGATVSVGTRTASTDGTGAYTLTGVPSGSQAVAASATGYEAAVKTVNLPAGGTVTTNFALVRKPTDIVGEVRNAATLQPLAGATVSYSGGSTTTDALGRYRLADTPPGTHEVTASATGYVSKTQTVVVTLGAYATSDFGLSPTTVGGAFKIVTFEGGSLTHPASGVQKVSGSVSLDATAAVERTYSARVADAASSYLQQSFTPVADLYVSFLVKLHALPAGNTRIAFISNGGTTVGNVELTPGGLLRLRVGSTVIGTSTAPLIPGLTIRIGLHQRRGTGADGVLEGYVVNGNKPFGQPFALTTTGSWVTSGDRVRLGATTAAVLNANLDLIKLRALTMPSP